ncbi:MAG: hypothetical protein PHP08_02465 [Candidatus Dojkabacteria bacterium]|nr:hypothetical protein [Candidatus Dojkabacteria bacterium]
MNKDVNTQENKPKEENKKKGFLSGLIEVEQDPEKKEAPTTVPKQDVKQTQSKPEEKGLTEDQQLLVNTGDGVNLIPKKSKAEITKEKKKFSFSISSLISLAVLVILSLAIVLFNIVSKQQLNAANKELYSKELKMEDYYDEIISNNEILDRIDLYKYLQQNVFSPKEILEYIMAIVNESGNITIRSFDLSNSLGFEMNGSTSSLEVVSKLWYLLGIDDNIETINLESVGKSDEGANFSFKGQLNADYFISE